MTKGEEMCYFSKNRVAALSLAICLASRVASAVEVEGDVAGDWTVEDSPYVVIGDIHVPEGQQLTIESGVAVRFNEARRLVVNGVIVAEGEAGAPIVFTRNEDETMWRGIRVLQSQNENIFRFCQFFHSQQTDNYPQVDSRGGALYAERSNVIVEDCLFQFNRASGQGGAACFYHSEGEFNRNSVIENYGFTEIVWLQNSEIPCRYNSFISNEGDYGAGLILEASSPPVEYNLFRHNNSTTMTWGGSLYFVHNSTSIVRNNLVVQNNGGGVFIGYDADPASFEQNTVALNTGHSGVFMVNGGNMNAVNCIFWGNDNADVALSSGSASLSFSDVDRAEGAEIGQGVIRENPLFINSEGGDFGLEFGSPCRDTGDPDSPPDPDETRADMGKFFPPPYDIRWIPDEPVDFGTIGRGEIARRSIQIAYLNGIDQEILVLLQPNPADWWLHVRPGEEHLELGDTMSVRLELSIPEDADPGQYEAGVELRLDEDGPVFSELSVAAFVTGRFTLGLRRGWNLISLPLSPHEPAIPDVFRIIDDTGILIFVKDGRGRFYWPEEEFSNLPPWNSLEGYLVKVSQGCEVVAEGRPTPPDFTIPLTAGWNMIAYLPTEAQEAPEAFENLGGNLVIAKDGFGNFYHPARNHNGLPPLNQGSGDVVKVLEEAEFEWRQP